MDEDEARTFEPHVVFVDHDNRIVEVGDDASAMFPTGSASRTSGT